MPTKTKPIMTWESPFVPQVRLDDSGRSQIAELLGLNAEQTAIALDEIDHVLTLGTHRIHARASEPLSAHLAAELRPVADMAKRLADAINRLSSKARMRTRMVDGTDSVSLLWQALIEFSTDASITCDRLEQEGREYQVAVRSGAAEIPITGSDGGSRKANVRSARGGVREALGGIYDRYAVKQTARGRSSFLRIVTGKHQRG